MKIENIIPIFLEPWQFMPDRLEDGYIYISPSSEIAIHLCACGCGEKGLCGEGARETCGL